MYVMTDLTDLFFSSTLKVLESFEEIHFEMRISIFLCSIWSYSRRLISLASDETIEICTPAPLDKRVNKSIVYKCQTVTVNKL